MLKATNRPETPCCLMVGEERSGLLEFQSIQEPEQFDFSATSLSVRNNPDLPPALKIYSGKNICKGLELTSPAIFVLAATLISANVGPLLSIIWSLALFPVWCFLLESRMRQGGSANDTLLFIGLVLIFAGIISWLKRLDQNLKLRASAMTIPAYLIYSLIRCRLPPKSRSFLDSPSAIGLTVGDCRWCCGRRRRLDHHCLWLNVCVHAGTHADFVVTVALGAIASTTFTFVTLTDLAIRVTPTDERNSSWFAAVLAAHAASPWDFALSLSFAPAAFGAIMVLTVQAVCIAGNRTARDLCAPGGSRPGSGPDAGLVYNCWRFWAGRWDLLAPPPLAQPLAPTAFLHPLSSMGGWSAQTTGHAAAAADPCSWPMNAGAGGGVECGIVPSEVPVMPTRA